MKAIAPKRRSYNRLHPLALVVLALGAMRPAAAGDAPPQFGRYLPKYPAIYYTLGYAHDARDSSFDGDGSDRDSAVPTVAGNTAFPETLQQATFTSYFPLFEDADIPYLSSRLHLARLSLAYGESETEGALRDYIATNPEYSPRSQPGDNGIRDVGVELGSFLVGGGDWRTRKDTPLAVVLLVNFDVPNGSYEQTSPVTQGSNRYAWGTTLGAHWRPWSGGFVEAGAGLRAYGDNHNAHFGRLAPTRQGDDTLLNLSLTQRLFRHAYLGAFVTDRRGQANDYVNPRYAPNAPQPDPAPPNGTTESYPIPGTYRDQGTALRTAGVTFNYFVTQRLMAAVDYAIPLSGKSGQMLVNFRQRQCPAGSAPGSGSCTESDFPDPVLVDGQGSARSFSSDNLRVSLSYNFGHADPYACTGCEQ